MKSAFRIGHGRYYTDQEFEKLLRFIKKHHENIDELALFTEYSHHGYYPLEEVESLSVILKKRIPALKKVGIQSVGINILDTLGHIDEAWDVLTPLPFQSMVGHDGLVSRSCSCPTSEAYKAYIQNKYHLLAQANPDFIWVDDDIRMHHHTVAYACFCTNCINIFNTNNHTNYNREHLVAVLNSSEGAATRAAWMQQNHDTLCNLLEMLHDCVGKVNPEIKLGLMTSGITWGSYSNPDYGAWMESLGATKGRPGGGFSNDDMPIDVIRKLFECERQISLYPDQVSDIQYEMENFPYQRLYKAIYTVMMECTASLVTGHTGIAFNALVFDDYPELMEAIKTYAGMWRSIVKLSEGLHSSGLHPCFKLLHPQWRKVEDRNWFNSAPSQKVDEAYVLAQIGIPLTMEPSGACANILVGTMAEAYTDAELEAMLKKGVLMDGISLGILLSRGFEDFCGVRIADIIDNGVRERFNDHYFNGTGADKTRDVYITFWGEDSKSYVLEPVASNVQILSTLETITGDNLGPCSYIYENRYGGRISVMGYMPWKFLHSSEKRFQMNEVADWISYNHLPVRIKECLKIAPFVRRSPNRDACLILLINCFLDETGLFQMEVDVSDTCKAYTIAVDGSVLPYDRCTKNGKDKLVLDMETMKPWEFRVIYLGCL